MKNFGLFLLWLPMGCGLTILSAGGWESIGIRLDVAWLIAAGNTLAGGVFAWRFRQTGDWFQLGLCALAVSLAACTDAANFRAAIQSSNIQPAVVAEAKAEAEAERVEALRAAVATAEGRLDAKRQEAAAEAPTESERGPKWRELMRQADQLAAAVALEQANLAAALAEAGEAAVDAVDKEAGQHPLALVPFWALLAGCFVLETVAAAIAYGARVAVVPAVEAAAVALPAPAAVVPSPNRLDSLTLNASADDFERITGRADLDDLAAMARAAGRLSRRIYREMERQSTGGGNS